MLEKAVEIITKEFKNKKDKAGKPYIDHLWRVKETVHNEIWGNYELETVALLHDLLEDCPNWNKEKLLDIFPKSVVDSVVCLTRKKNESYKEYIDRILTDDMATLVKKADLRDNMDITRLKTLNEADFIRLKKYHSSYMQLVS